MNPPFRSSLAIRTSRRDGKSYKRSTEVSGGSRGPGSVSCVHFLCFIRMPPFSRVKGRGLLHKGPKWMSILSKLASCDLFGSHESCLELM